MNLDRECWIREATHAVCVLASAGTIAAFGLAFWCFFLWLVGLRAVLPVIGWAMLVGGALFVVAFFTGTED